jgi:hypothetical protein
MNLQEIKERWKERYAIADGGYMQSMADIAFLIAEVERLESNAETDANYVSKIKEEIKGLRDLGKVQDYLTKENKRLRDALENARGALDAERKIPDGLKLANALAYIEDAIVPLKQEGKE